MMVMKVSHPKDDKNVLFSINLMHFVGMRQHDEKGHICEVRIMLEGGHEQKLLQEWGISFEMMSKMIENGFTHFTNVQFNMQVQMQMHLQQQLREGQNQQKQIVIPVGSTAGLRQE